MANIDLYKQKLVAIANAIREKLGEQSTYKLEQMPAKILSIPSGSGDFSIANGYTYKDGNFGKDFSLTPITTFNNITVENGYEPLSVTRS